MAEQVFKKEADSFYYNERYEPSNCRNDFTGDDELTVKITLHEYRQMVWTIAKNDERMRDKEDEARKLRAERDELKSRVDALVLKLTGGDVEDDEDD